MIATRLALALVSLAVSTLFCAAAVRAGETPPPTATPLNLVGDCNGDGCVRIDELVTGVAIALGERPETDCPPIVGCNHLPGVHIDCLITAVVAALNVDCPQMPTATATPSATPTENALRLPDLHGEPDPDAGGRIADAEGREVLLRGVNVNALVEYWQGSAFPTVFPLTEADADLMASIGWNAVRLLLSWSRVEPQPGAYDAAYLDEVRAAVRLLASRGLYSIIDLHQDAWSATLAARPDEVCLPGFQLALGWDGAPAWAT